jgi:hypothetical protein
MSDELKSARDEAEWIFQSQAPGPEIKWGHCAACDATLNRTLNLILSRDKLNEEAALRKGQLIEAKIALATIVASGLIAIEDRRSQTLTAFRQRIAELENNHGGVFHQFTSGPAPEGRGE